MTAGKFPPVLVSPIGRWLSTSQLMPDDHSDRHVLTSAQVFPILCRDVIWVT